mmetsp:Transcript_5462/g.8888  ORF Transcript_5462/g.8888 Transcript_5462/m.8888 type:complete len:210 (-) Transcript_5462:209-838(-)
MRFVQSLLFVSEFIQWLPVGRLVPPKPLADSSHHSRALCFNILNVIQLGCKFVGCPDGDDFPIQLPIIDHCQTTENFHFLNRTHWKGFRTDFNDIDWIVVSCAFSDGVSGVWIFPSLWKHAIVPKYWTMVIAQLPFLDILCDWIVFFICGDFHLRFCHLWNLEDSIDDARFARFQRNIMPRRNVFTRRVLEVQAKLWCAALTLRCSLQG